MRNFNPFSWFAISKVIERVEQFIKPSFVVANELQRFDRELF